MSIPVPLERLRAAIAERGGSAYVLTVSDDGSPHAVHASVRWEGDVLSVDLGRRSAANVGARSAASLLYPVRSDEDYSLIVDGTATVASGDGGQRLLLTPTRAVLHRRPRPAAPTASSCDADCVPLFPPPRRA
jgi:Pyridoxamine 5'-phosphate oxidase